MPIKLASRLHRNRFGIYGFRLVIPKNMRLLFSQTEYRYSLKTTDKLRAKYLAFHLGNLVHTHFERISQSVNFEQAFNNAQQLLKSLEIDSSEKHTNFLIQLSETAEGADRERVMRLLELRKRSDKIEQEKLSMLNQYTLAMSNCSESEVDSITCDFYAELTPLKNEESNLSQQLHEISTELQGLIYERIHTNNIDEITETFNKDKENLAGFVSQIIAKSASVNPQSTSSNQTNGFNTQPSEKLLSEVIHEYCDNQKAESRWTLKSESTVNAVFVLWLRIVGDQPIASYGFEQHRSYKSKLQKLPPNINKSPKYHGKTIEQIIALNEKPSATHTTNNSLTRISGFFEWAIKYGFVTFNPAKGMTIKNPKRANEERKAFSDVDLKKLFSTEIYTLKKFKYPYHFWLPLLALYTGARLNELCQLHLLDFETIEGIKIIQISDQNGVKKVKTKAGNRIIPIHPELIRLGLLDFVDSLKKRGEIRLFPELKMSRDGYGQAASKWFARYSTICGVDEEGKVFHSFRHTFINNLKQLGIPKEKIAELVGHEEESETFGRYGKSFEVLQMSEVVNGLNFNVIFEIR